MDIYTVRNDGREDLLCSGMDSADVPDFLEWFSYTKPLGPSTKIVIRASSTLIRAVTSAGFDNEPVARTQPSRAA